MTKSGKGIHRVAPGTRGARKLAASTARIVTPQPSAQAADVREHNRQIDERNEQRRLKRSAKK